MCLLAHSSRCYTKVGHETLNNIYYTEAPRTAPREIVFVVYLRMDPVLQFCTTSIIGTLRTRLLVGLRKALSPSNCHFFTMFPESAHLWCVFGQSEPYSLKAAGSRTIHRMRLRAIPITVDQCIVTKSIVLIQCGRSLLLLAFRIHALAVDARRMLRLCVPRRRRSSRASFSIQR